jgi:spore germination protein GerM
MRRALVVVAVTGLALAGCGVPNDASPRSLPKDAVPFELLSPDSTGVTTTTLVAVSAEVSIYLVGSDRLVAVRRLVESPVTLFRVLETLLAGRTGEEAASGLRSAIVNTQLISVRSQSGVATIDLSSDFATIGGQDQILAVAQLVFTTTSLPGVVGIKLSLDGRAVEVPRGDGTLTQDPLKPADFAAFAPVLE